MRAGFVFTQTVSHLQSFVIKCKRSPATQQANYPAPIVRHSLASNDSFSVFLLLKQAQVQLRSSLNELGSKLCFYLDGIIT